MNETSYNFAMLGTEFLDKVINGIQDVAPKVWWYLQWKCYLGAIKAGIFLIMGIIILISLYYILKNRQTINDNGRKFSSIFNKWMYATGDFFLIPIILLSLFAVVTIIINIYIIVYSFTPICPIDIAINIGNGLIQK